MGKISRDLGSSNLQIIVIAIALIALLCSQLNIKYAVGIFS